MSAHVTLFDPATGVRATVLDVYGATHPSDDDGTLFMWTEGNYSCDCNKRLFLCRAGAPGYEGEAEKDRDDVVCEDDIVLEKIVCVEDGRVLYELDGERPEAKVTILAPS